MPPDGEDEDGSWETPCPDSDDGSHCEHWYDGEECHFCGGPADLTFRADL